MSLVSDLRALLRRPLAPPAPPSGAPGRKRPAGHADLATEQDFVDALERLSEEREAAQTRLETAGEEREKLLLAGDSYGAILRLNAEIDEAQFLLEQQERLAPDLQRSLRIIRFEKHCARWIEVRDATAAAAEAQLAAIEAYRSALAQWRETYSAVAAEYPEAVEVLPQMPSLFQRADFGAQIAAFRTRILERGSPAQPLFLSLAEAIYHAKRTGEIPDNVPSDWRIDIERAMTGEAKVRLNTSIIDPDGKTINKGQVLVLPYDDAQGHVSSGRAVWA